MNAVYRTFSVRFAIRNPPRFPRVPGEFPRCKGSRGDGEFKA